MPHKTTIDTKGGTHPGLDQAAPAAELWALIQLLRVMVALRIACVIFVDSSWRSGQTIAERRPTKKRFCVTA